MAQYAVSCKATVWVYANNKKEAQAAAMEAMESAGRGFADLAVYPDKVKMSDVERVTDNG